MINILLPVIYEIAMMPARFAGPLANVRFMPW
jgi:hypothetical protein